MAAFSPSRRPLELDIPAINTQSAFNRPLRSPPLSPPVSYRNRNTRPDGPPRNRHTTPPPPEARREMEEFAAHCRAWYFEQNDAAGKLVSQIMDDLPPSHRAAYMKLQASIRSAYHQSVAARRLAEFNAQLSSVTPNGSLTPSARAIPNGSIARKERYDRFASFLESWCSPAIPGTTPFFQGLWALMRLQALSESLGGAGQRLIEWELDDAVFRETAGKEFMLASITIMKGVLGFHEFARPSRSPSASTTDLHGNLAGLQDGNIHVHHEPLTNDPFMDKTLARSATPSYATEASLRQDSLNIPLLTDNASEKLDEQYLRVWRTPDLSNPELQSLLSLFPSFITRREVPLFAKSDRRAPHTDLESGLDIDCEKEVRCGSGRMWIGVTDRTLVTMKGSVWDRFVSWWRSLFCF